MPFHKPSAGEITAFCDACGNRQPDGGCAMNVSVRAEGIRSRSMAVMGLVLHRFVDPDELQDMLDDTLARTLGLTDQERYVRRHVCYKAEQSGKRGQMIDGVFHAYERAAASVA